MKLYLSDKRSEGESIATAWFVYWRLQAKYRENEKSCLRSLGLAIYLPGLYEDTYFDLETLSLREGHRRVRIYFRISAPFCDWRKIRFSFYTDLVPIYSTLLYTQEQLEDGGIKL